MRIALSNPQFSFEYKAEDEKNSMRLVFKRRTDAMPSAPKVSSSTTFRIPFH
jgi:hypothetical protein